MTSSPTIAHYRITSQFGEGGMGAVYRATEQFAQDTLRANG